MQLHTHIHTHLILLSSERKKLEKIKIESPVSWGTGQETGWSAMELGKQPHWVQGVFRENVRRSKVSERVCSEFWSISIENTRGRMGKVMVIEWKPSKADWLRSDDPLATVRKDILQRVQVHHLTTGIIILPTSWGWPPWSLFWLVGSWPGNLLTLLQSLLRRDCYSILGAWHVMYLLRSKIEFSFHSFEQEGVVCLQWTSRNPFLVLPEKT